MRISAWFSRILLIWLLTPALAPAQELRILGSSAELDVQTVLRHGDLLQRDGRWGDLVEHYRRAAEAQPQAAVLQQRLTWAQARQNVAQRYTDASFRESVRTLSDREAIDVYSELLAKVKNHYVDTPSWSTLVKRGLVFSQAALETQQTRQFAPPSSQAHCDSLKAELAKHLGSRSINDVREAREAAWFAGQLAKQRIGLPPAALILEFVAGATAALDPYSSFLTPDQLDEVFSQIEGNFVGLGVELETRADALKIVNVIPGGPAATAGLLAGDLIVQIDGRTVTQLGGNTAANMLRGDEGSLVTVGVSRVGQPQRQIKIVRRVVEVPSVVDARILDSTQGVGYFRLASFQKSTNEDVDNALWALHRKGMRSLIIDLRGNPGGLLDASVRVADKFLSGGSIVSTRGRTEQFEFTAHHEGTWNVPLVVLIDNDSASASEILAGALRDHERCQIIGTRSYGKGSVQGIFPLSIGKMGVRLTTAKFYSPSGRAISKNGVMPHMLVHAAAKPNAAGAARPSSDAALASALQQARGQLTRQTYARQSR